MTICVPFVYHLAVMVRFSSRTGVYDIAVMIDDVLSAGTSMFIVNTTNCVGVKLSLRAIDLSAISYTVYPMFIGQ